MTPRALLLPAFVAAAVAVIALAFAQSRPAAGHTASVVTGHNAPLKISNYAFIPSDLAVRVGTKITVTNGDSTAHTITSSSGAFDSGTVRGDKSASFTVTKPGVYAYICQFHAFMNGTIKVLG